MAQSTLSLSYAEDGGTGEPETEYFLSVRCGPEPATFTAVVLPIVAPLPAHAHWLHGEV